MQTRRGEKDGNIVSFVSHIELNGSQNTTGNKVESHERSHVNPILAQFSKHDVKSRKNSQALKFTTRHECEEFLLQQGAQEVALSVCLSVCPGQSCLVLT